MVTRGEIGERVARLEELVEQLHDDYEKQREVLERISSELTRYKGFIGGIMFIVSAVFAFFKAMPMLSGLFQK